MADRLHLKVEEDQLNEYRADFLDSNLRHTRHTQVDLASDPDCPALVFSLYRDLLAVAQDKKDLDTDIVQRRLKQAWKGVQVLQPILRSMDRLLHKE